MKAKIFGCLAMAAVTGLFALAIFSPKFVNAQETPPPDTQQVNAQPTAAEEVLPPDIESNAVLSEVIRLSQAGVSEDVITNYINNVQYKFNLTANDIIYLKDIGMPDSIVLAMQQRDQQLGVTVSTPPPQAAPAPPPTTTVVTETYFYDSLAPYGSWVYVEGYGRCWRPSVVVYNSSWQPYCDGGHWVWTDCGWYWYSDYSWGWAPFHYGRWFLDARFGWCWFPDTVWGPSWVCWRYSDDYCGWAPLPPRCEYREGVGLFFNGSRVSVEFDFGLSVGAFTFVGIHDFCDPHPWRHRVDRDRVTEVFNHTTVINNITVNNNGNNNTTVVNNGGHNTTTTIVNNGIPVEHVTAVTHTPIHQVHIRETDRPVGRGEQVDRSGTLVVNRPHFDRNASQNLNNNQQHTIPSPTTGQPMQVPPVQPQNANQNRNNNPPNRNQENRFGSTLPQIPETTTPPANENQRNNSQNRNQSQNRNMTPGTPVQVQPPPNNNRNFEQQNNPPAQTPPANNGQIRRTEPVTPPSAPAENRRNLQEPPQPVQQPQRNYEPPVRQNPTPPPAIVQPQAPQQQQPDQTDKQNNRGRGKDKNDQ